MPKTDFHHSPSFPTFAMAGTWRVLVEAVQRPGWILLGKAQNIAIRCNIDSMLSKLNAFKPIKIGSWTSRDGIS